MTALARTVRGILVAVRRRPGVFAGVALAVFLLDLFVPPLVLSLARKPVSYFTFNPWLSRLPEYLTSNPAPLGEKLDKLSNLALFWFSSDNPYGLEWGFAVTVADLGRFLLMSLLIGAYFALWSYRRLAGGPVGRGLSGGRQGGVLGMVTSVLGLSTGGCTVMGCGAPVLPVVGLAFAGLSSTTLKWLAGVSSVATWVVLVGMGAGVAYLGWRAGAPTAPYRGGVQSARVILNTVPPAEPPASR
jgi:hypothetical protein